MAHLPEPIQEPRRRVVAPRPARSAEPDPIELDEPPLDDDPVVRQPKHLAEMPEIPMYPRRLVARVGALAAGVGMTLGAMGLLVAAAVTQLRLPSLARFSFGARTASGAAGSTGADGGAARAMFSFDLGDGGALASGDAAVSYVASAVAPSPLAAQTPEGWVATQHRLGRGRTLPQVLRALSISGTTASRVISAMRTLLNMRALQPGDVVVAQRDPTRNNELRRVEYRRGEDEVISVTVAPDQTCSAERIRVVKSTVRVAAGFTVRGSLDETLRAAHLHPDIVGQLQTTFRELDLGRGLSVGDSVRLVVDEERVNDAFWRYARITAIELRTASGAARRGYWFATSQRGGDYFDGQGTANVPGVLQPPVNPPRITSPFNPHRMHPVLHRVMPHQGTDFGAPSGTPVMAAADGVVVFRGWGGATGNLVRLAHAQLNLETGYAHLVRFEPSVGSGARVRVGQVIGYVGSTGRSTGPHLHWSVKRSGQFIDGAPFLAWRRSVQAAQRPQFDAIVAQLNAELDAVRVDGTATPGAAAGGTPAQPGTARPPGTAR
jgi:murein DD-endopeptidase MepM/ murein hydrolase activator NlpD